MNNVFFRLDYNEIRDFCKETDSGIGSYLFHLGKYKRIVNHLKNLDSFQGEYASQVKNYFEEVHGTIANSIYDCLLLFKNFTALYQIQFMEVVDSAYEARIYEEAIRDMRTEFQNGFRRLDNIIDEVNRSLLSIEDIMPINLLSTDNLAYEVDALNQYITQTENQVIELDNSFVGIYLTELKQSIQAAKALIQQYAGQNRAIEDFGCGLNPGKKYLSDCQEALTQLNASLSGNTRLDTAKATQNQMEKAYEEAKAAQKEYGIRKTISIGISFIPVIGDAKDLQEAVTGVDWITEEKLSVFERIVSGACVLIPVISGKAIRAAFKGGEKVVSKELKATIKMTDRSKELLEIEIAGKKLSGKVVQRGEKALHAKNVKKLNKNLNQTIKGSGNSLFSKKLDSILTKYELTLDEFNTLRLKDVDKLTEDEIKVLKNIREEIPKPDSNTIFQKAIPASDIELYLNGKYRQVKGFMSRMDDVSQLDNYEDIYNSLRLDYKNTPYHLDSDDTLGIIRYTTDNADQIEVPYCPEFGGRETSGTPFTGNGFTKATNGQIIPEYKSDYLLKLQNGAQLYEVRKDGTKILKGIYNEHAGKFIECKRGGKQ